MTKGRNNKNKTHKIKTKKTKKKKTKKTKETKLKSNFFKNIRNNLKTSHISSGKAILDNKEDKYSINLIHKFGGGKSGDLVYLIEKDHKKYVLKVFKKKKESKNEITIHTKMNKLFENDIPLVPIIYSFGIIDTIPFINQKGKFNYMILEFIGGSYEISDYIRENCKTNHTNKINPYYLGLQLFYYLAKIGSNNLNHCDIHTKNIMVIKVKKTIELDFSNIDKSFQKKKVGKYQLKIIDFGLSTHNKSCPKNRRVIMPVLQDLYKCRLLGTRDINHISKEIRSIVSSKLNTKGSYTINEDLYIFIKILRLLCAIKHKGNRLTNQKIEIMRIAVKSYKFKEAIYEIYHTLM